MTKWWLIAFYIRSRPCLNRAVDGRIEVLLVTSRETQRWILPKGNIGRALSVSESAEREAYEEAGVRGSIASRIPLGFYTCYKALAGGETVPAVVEVYLLSVEKLLSKWPEKGERHIAWVRPSEAIQMIGEPGLIPLLHRAIEIEPNLLGRAEPAGT